MNTIWTQLYAESTNARVPQPPPKKGTLKPFHLSSRTCVCVTYVTV